MLIYEHNTYISAQVSDCVKQDDSLYPYARLDLREKMTVDTIYAFNRPYKINFASVFFSCQVSAFFLYNSYKLICICHSCPIQLAQEKRKF